MDRDHQGVAGPDELEHGLEFLPAGSSGAAGLLLPDHLAPRRVQGGKLDGEILIRGTYPRVADHGHWKAPCLVWI